MRDCALASRLMVADPSQPQLSPPPSGGVISFNRQELSEILAVYGRMVAAGHWRDYAIDQLKDAAVFSIFRRSSETPLYRIEKRPALHRKQGAWRILAPGGLILRRGHELSQVLRLFDRSRFAVVD